MKPGTREEDRQTEDDMPGKIWARAAYLVLLIQRK